MLVSIITIVLNAKDTIEDTIQSVLNQTYKNIEYIIIDGESIDRTLEIIDRYRDKISKFISEKDNGIYDAMNKGIGIATGDIIGFLHSDDLFTNINVIERVVKAFKKHNVQSSYGDLVYVNRHNVNSIFRYWRAGEYKESLIKRGWMPPHPTFFVKKWVYEKYGYFNTNFKIAADYEVILRFLYKHKISTYYIPELLVKMRMGGNSNRNFKNVIKKSIEDYKAWKVNKLKAEISTIVLKNVLKIPQFFIKGG